MAEAIQEQQPAQPQPDPQIPLDMSDEAIMGRALGQPMPERDPQTGRFVAQQPATEQSTAPAPAPAEQQAEKPAEPDAEAPSQEEVKWDDVKDVKIKVPMKVDGKEWTDEVTIEQLRNERMLQADYSRKTQAVAEKERQIAAQTQQAVDKERAQYLEALNTLQSLIRAATTPELANVDWNKLAAENPAEYVRLSNRAREVNEAMQRIGFEQEKVQKQQAQERDSRLAQAVQDSRTKLKEAIPTWNDDLYQSLLKRGVDTYGFKSDEMDQVWDHRIMRVLHDAHQWNAMQEGKPLADKKVVDVPSVLRPGNAKPKVDPRTNELQQARDRLAANGNDMDAAAALMGNFVGKK